MGEAPAGLFSFEAWVYCPLPIAGNYFEQRCADGTFNCVPTIAAGLNASNVGGSVSITQVRIVRCLVCEEESVEARSGRHGLLGYTRDSE